MRCCVASWSDVDYGSMQSLMLAQKELVVPIPKPGLVHSEDPSEDHLCGRELRFSVLIEQRDLDIGFILERWFGVGEGVMLVLLFVVACAWVPS